MQIALPIQHFSTMVREFSCHQFVFGKLLSKLEYIFGRRSWNDSTKRREVVQNPFHQVSRFLQKLNQERERGDLPYGNSTIKWTIKHDLDSLLTENEVDADDKATEAEDFAACTNVHDSVKKLKRFQIPSEPLQPRLVALWHDTTTVRQDLWKLPPKVLLMRRNLHQCKLNDLIKWQLVAYNSFFGRFSFLLLSKGARNILKYKKSTPMAVKGSKENVHAWV